jgi:hypothetical protein
LVQVEQKAQMLVVGETVESTQSFPQLHLLAVGAVAVMPKLALMAVQGVVAAVQVLVVQELQIKAAQVASV